MAIYRATVSGTLFGQLVQNVLHFRQNEPPPNVHTVLINNLINNFYGQIRLFVNSAMNWHQIRVDTMEDPPPFPTIVTTNFSGAWSTHNILWGPLTTVFQIKTAFPGRKGRGRFYISGDEPQGLLNGVWESGRQGLHNSVANSIKGNYVGVSPATGFELGVYPRNTTDPTEFKAATDLIARALPGTQGRRNIGRGK